MAPDQDRSIADHAWAVRGRHLFDPTLPDGSLPDLLADDLESADLLLPMKGTTRGSAPVPDLDLVLPAMGTVDSGTADVSSTGLTSRPAELGDANGGATGAIPIAAANSVGSDGDADLMGPAARSTYDVSGAGIRIGILSDSFDYQNANASAVATEESDGDLPSTVTVLADYTGGTDSNGDTLPAGTDEGRAMAELVHQVAPGAQIYFATGYPTEETFATDILALANAGCKVIVDDLSYLDEPFFATTVGGAAIPNVIAQAISTVIAEGVSYFTSAGNQGSNYYEAAISTVAGTLPDGTSATLQNFGTAEAVMSGSSTLQSITLASMDPVEIDLQWNQPFRDNGYQNVGSGPSYSLALYLYTDNATHTGHTLVASSTVNVTTTSDPVQVLSYTNPGTVSANYDLAIVVNGGTVVSGSTLKYIIISEYGSSAATIHDANAGTGGSATFGHSDLAAANVVAAAPASNPGTAESFSSVGTISGTDVDFTAPDGIATSVSGFSSFYGTSAAAPDAAAVGVLVLQANPNLTPAEVTAALASTATAMSDGVAKDGAGFVNADAAVAAAEGDLWQQAAGGTWTTSADWLSGTPGSTTYATLSDDAGTLTSSYTVTTSGTDTASTLTVGNAATISVGLSVVAGSLLSVAGGATVGQYGSLADAGTVTVGGALTGAGTVSVAAAATLSVAGSLSAVGIVLASTSDLVLSGSVATLDSSLTSVISLSGTGALIDLTSVSSNATLVSYSSGTLAIRVGMGSTLDLEFNSTQITALSNFTKSNDGTNHLLLGVACYLRGTRIATPSGEVLVELLRIGDPVLTASGAVRPIRWIGRRTHTPEATAAERHLRPIRIRAGALSDGLPRRDLLVSPEHALLLRDGDAELLVPASLLVNGTSIAALEGGSEAAYFHLEFKSHEAIRAEGQPAESFVDDHSRAMFDNAGEYDALYPPPPGPQFPTPPAQFCARRIGAGPELARLRVAIDARADLSPGPLLGHLDIATADQFAGWVLDTVNPLAPVVLELLVDGIVVAVTVADRHRADLAEVTASGGLCGFLFTPPADLAAPGRRIVAIRRAGDGAGLRGAERLIDFAPVTDDFTLPATDPAARLAFLTDQIAALRRRRVAA